MPPQISPAVAARVAAKPSGRADQLARTLAADILGGGHPVGSRLPGEPELAAANGLSVATVRAALLRLEALGLIAPGHGDGALVTSGEVRALYQVSADTQAGGDYVAETAVAVERRRMVRADAELAVFLDVREGSEWLHLTGLRLPPDPSFGPLSWVDLWLAGGVPEVPDSLTTTTDTLEALLGVEIAELREEVSAAPLTPAQARQLRARGGEGSLHVMRRYFRANGSLAAGVRDVHPAGRISVLLHTRRRAR